MRNINFFDHFRFFKNRPKWKSPAVGERTLWKWVGDIIRRHLGGKLVRIEMNVALSLEETPAGYWLCVFWFFFSSSSTCSLLLFFFLAVSAFFSLSLLFFILNFLFQNFLLSSGRDPLDSVLLKLTRRTPLYVHVLDETSQDWIADGLGPHQIYHFGLKWKQNLFSALIESSGTCQRFSTNCLNI